MENPYINLKSSFNAHHNSLFEETEIVIKIKKIFPTDRKEWQNESYSILNIEFNSDNENSVLINHLKLIVDDINKRMEEEQKNGRHWQIFYLLKELIQGIEDFTSRSNKTTYFRGQCQDWEVLPGILRDDTTPEYLNNFEGIYKKIANNYPGDISYYEYRNEKDVLQKRAQQLSLLQHYGLRTSLVDITRNPYVALLFMTMGKEVDFSSGTLDCFIIDEEEDSNSNIFMSIPKSIHNKRLDAQEGAFFNYDLLNGISFSDRPHPIECIRLKIDSSKEVSLEHLESLRDEQEKLKQRLYKTWEPDEDSSIKLEDLIEMLDENINEMKSESDRVNQNTDLGISKVIRSEIKRKLSEYYYFEKNLFPDLDKYIQYIQNEYLTTGLSSLNR
ncbi:FRG domain-containing protein [Lactococcus lactis]|uniref:FRG domain-containing protein n=1 Tax=Lactococcus lactis TaxID=1358 RepID=A0AAP8E1N2_9LACT|nr:FRG domain-containing protein [Lactococcus lactis]MDG4970477.1 FRG domain-containing protein [Lactococcus lactis]PFG89210.1 hypothetical protein BW154_06970 [Lactococcus lactis]